MGNVFCFNGFNSFTWFNMGRITKNDRCLIKTIKTENITHKRNMRHKALLWINKQVWTTLYIYTNETVL